MAVTAALIKELRERTGVGMMDCKKALEEAKGDIEAAIKIMRKAGHTKAAKKVDRVAAEGVIVIKADENNKNAVMAEINCETDFAARDKSFLEFTDKVIDFSLSSGVGDLDTLLKSALEGEQTVSDVQKNLIATIGENINIRRIKNVKAKDDGVISSYVHSNKRIGVLVSLSVSNYDLGKDIAMHIAASNPVAINSSDIPEDILNEEKKIQIEQLKNSGKPAEIIEKIVSGRMEKFIGESALVKQPFVKDPDITVENLLNKFNAKVLDFVRFEVGEGIEKKEVDFATEVKNQAKAVR